MGAVLIRNLPAEVLAALHERAKRNTRSLQGELHQVLVNLAQQELAAKPLEPIRLTLASGTSGSGTWSREEIYGDDGR